MQIVNKNITNKLMEEFPDMPFDTVNFLIQVYYLLNGRPFAIYECTELDKEKFFIPITLDIGEVKISSYQKKYPHINPAILKPMPGSHPTLEEKNAGELLKHLHYLRDNGYIVQIERKLFVKFATHYLFNNKIKKVFEKLNSVSFSTMTFKEYILWLWQNHLKIEFMKSAHQFKIYSMLYQIVSQTEFKSHKALFNKGFPFTNAIDGKLFKIPKGIDPHLGFYNRIQTSSKQVFDFVNTAVFYRLIFQVQNNGMRRGRIFQCKIIPPVIEECDNCFAELKELLKSPKKGNILVRQGESKKMGKESKKPHNPSNADGIETSSSKKSLEETITESEKRLFPDIELPAELRKKIDATNNKRKQADKLLLETQEEEKKLMEEIAKHRKEAYIKTRDIALKQLMEIAKINPELIKEVREDLSKLTNM